MATMIPPEPGPGTRSRAERKLFDRFRRELDDRWTVFHSVGIADHPKKNWAQIDFVAVGPPGIFCLEVKGGRVARDAKGWIFTRKDGGRDVKREGPFEQVGGAEAQLRGFLKDHKADRGTAGQFAIGWGVMMPDVEFTIEGPDIEPEVLFDARDVSKSLTHYVARLDGYWRARLAARRGSPPPALSAGDVGRVAAVLRPEFDFRPSLRTRIGLVEDEMIQLTREQMQVVGERELNPRAVVLGGAGTGKSLLAVEDARGYALKGQSVLLVCFNALLAEWLRAACADLENVHVHHVHGLMHKLIDAADLVATLPDASPDDLLNLFYPEAAQTAIGLLDLVDFFDVLVIDEAQDLLRPDLMDLLEFLLRGGFKDGTWRVYYDPRQNLFAGIGVDALPRLDAARPARFRLSVNCRNTAPIAANTALLAGTPLEETRSLEGPEVEQYFWEDRGAQGRLLIRTIERWLSAGVRPSEIVVLSRRRWENSTVAGVGRKSSFRIVDGRGPVGDRDVRFFTTSAYKGLESTAVAFIDIDDLGSPEAQASLYVGASRARALLGVFMDRGVRRDYEERAREFGERLAELDG